MGAMRLVALGNVSNNDSTRTRKPTKVLRWKTQKTGVHVEQGGNLSGRPFAEQPMKRFFIRLSLYWLIQLLLFLLLLFYFIFFGSMFVGLHQKKCLNEEIYKKKRTET